MMTTDGCRTLSRAPKRGPTSELLEAGCYFYRDFLQTKMTLLNFFFGWQPFMYARGKKHKRARSTPDLPDSSRSRAEPEGYTEG